MARKIPLSSKETDQIISSLIDNINQPSQIPIVITELKNLIESKKRINAPKLFSFGLTERERDQIITQLNVLLMKKQTYDISLEALVKIAILLADGSLTYDITREIILGCLKTVLGKSISTIEQKYTHQIREDIITKKITILYGIVLNLTWDNQLCSIDVNPSKIKERGKFFSFIGISSDISNDISEKHNLYLGGTLT